MLMAYELGSKVQKGWVDRCLWWPQAYYTLQMELLEATGTPHIQSAKH